MHVKALSDYSTVAKLTYSYCSDTSNSYHNPLTGAADVGACNEVFFSSNLNTKDLPRIDSKWHIDKVIYSDLSASFFFVENDLLVFRSNPWCIRCYGQNRIVVVVPRNTKPRQWTRSFKTRIACNTKTCVDVSLMYYCHN